MSVSKPLVILNFGNYVKFYQYSNEKLKLKKSKKISVTKLMCYDLDGNSLDELIYQRGGKIYATAKNFKKKFSIKTKGWLSAADVNDDYKLEILVSTGKKLRIYSNAGVLLSQRKIKGKWLGVNFN